MGVGAQVEDDGRLDPFHQSGHGAGVRKVAAVQGERSLIPSSRTG